MHAVILFFFMLTDVLGHSRAAPTGDGTAVSHIAQNLDGPGLVTLGKKLNNPYLKVVGTALVNTFARLCDLMPCGEWSEWSKCSVVLEGQFGVRNRTRKCGGYAGFCRGQDKEVTTELDMGLCEGFCPAGYNYTTDGFCLKYIHQKMTQTDAEKYCLEEGSFLLNINSQIKSDSVTQMISGLPTSWAFWVDGKRTDNKSPWQFSYESDIVGFTNWVSHDPDNGTSDLCMFYAKASSEGWKRYDISCSGPYSFVCEKISSS